MKWYIGGEDFGGEWLRGRVDATFDLLYVRNNYLNQDLQDYKIYRIVFDLLDVRDECLN